MMQGQEGVAQGLADVKSQAVDVVASQLAQGSTLARVQLATLDAASARIAETPGAATTTYVLSQGETVDLVTVSSTSDSSTGRNVGLGLGGLALIAA